MPLAVLVVETLAKKHARKCYRQIHPGPEQKLSLHRDSACSRQVFSGSPTTRNNLRRLNAQNIPEKNRLGRYWGSWARVRWPGFKCGDHGPVVAVEGSRKSVGRYTAILASSSTIPSMDTTYESGMTVLSWCPGPPILCDPIGWFHWQLSPPKGGI